MAPFPAIEGLAPRFEDERGWVQVLHESERMVLKRSFSRAGVFRGMHLQLEPSPQVKLIRVVSGRIIDFVAAIHGETGDISHIEASAEQGWIRIAADLAHGFYALENTLFEYVCDGRYDAALERSFSIPEYLKKTCGIVDPIQSEKDRTAVPIG